MEFDELKEKYTQLREFALESQRTEYRERADWNILIGKCRDLERENEALTKKIEALKEEHKKQKETLKREYEKLKDELRYNDELIRKGVYNDFNRVIREKEEKFENKFPPIEE